ncbi:MBL fold metallo-hydrolase [Undibacterium sp. TS12]|uniref:MBL fold metallo-hydrolase n=1 Tax=Undibacterium sp. TS12 TaxID=2908202 RepID=UPI001F4CBB00|nr:MBL fold metallo-hydrolase [Undibacterium sp. TS12]MCH8620431.1 MBL fold metallo-hydrolase [Undibacterium sp. TS12]
MSAPQIQRISILPFGMVNCHLIIQGQNCIVVDTGLPGSAGKIIRALKRHGLDQSHIRLVVITHAHVDHAGSAAALRELSGAPIAGHDGDLAYYQQKQQMHFCSTGWFGRLFLRTGLILQPYQPFTPDILLSGDDTLDLNCYGITGLLKPTPGHTAGSLSVELPSRDAMVGDLLASGILLGGLLRTGHAIRPPFEDNALVVAQQLQNLLDAGVERFYMGHGGPLPAQEVAAHVRRLHVVAQPACCQH